jgi:hypothetical protein
VDTDKKSGEPVDLAPVEEGGDVMDVPNSDGSGDPSGTIPEPGGSSDTAAFTGIGPLTESEYERLTGNMVIGPSEKGDGWRSCAICLEEMDTDLRRHASCSCVLCESCIDVSLLEVELCTYYVYFLNYSL